MKKVLYRLQSYYNNQATETEKSVLKYILDNTKEVVYMDIYSLAKKGYCSPATIVRICKKNHFDGFRELKIALLNDLNFNDQLLKDSGIEIKHEDHNSFIRDILNESVTAINNTYNLVDYDEVNKIINLLKKAKIIRLFGMGASYLVAKDFQLKLERINKTTVLFEDTHMQIISSNNLKPDEVAFMISYSGKTKEINEMAQNMKKKGGTIISLTQYSNNKLMQIADYNLFVPKIERPLRIGATSSRISQLSVIDYLYRIYMESDGDEVMLKILSTKELLEKEDYSDEEGGAA